MRVKIFICHHTKPAHVLNTPLFSNLLSNEETASDGSYIGDLSGENIAWDNRFTELRHHYYVWKNLLSNYDYVGFEHYRRMFFIDLLPIGKLKEINPELLRIREWQQLDQQMHFVDVDANTFDDHITMRKAFSVSEIREFCSWLSKYEVIIPRTWSLRGWPDLAGQWKRSGAPPEMWELMQQAISSSPRFQPIPTLPVWSAAFNNCYIMRSEIFDDYMNALFGTIDKLGSLMKGSIADFPRMWGYVAERFLNFYLFSRRMENPLISIMQHPFLIRSSPDLYVRGFDANNNPIP